MFDLVVYNQAMNVRRICFLITNKTNTLNFPEVAAHISPLMSLVRRNSRKVDDLRKMKSAGTGGPKREIARSLDTAILLTTSIKKMNLN